MTELRITPIILVLVALAVFFWALPTGSNVTSVHAQSPDTLRYRNLDSNLNRIVGQAQTGQSAARAAAASAPIHRGESVAVTLHVTEGYVQDVWDRLETMRASPRNRGADYIEAYISVPLLPMASELEGVVRIRTILPPMPAQGHGRQRRRGAAWCGRMAQTPDTKGRASK